MVTVRQVKDLTILMEWRKEVIRSVFGIEADKHLLEANRDYYSRHIPEGSHIAVIAEKDGVECGCGAICLTEELPSPDNPSGRCGYLMNIYVREAFRNHGIAHHIVRTLLKEARRRDCGKIYLETTNDGKPVYSSLGFRDMPDMMKYDYYDTED